MDDILLIGGGGHCRAVIDVIEQENKYNIVGIIDCKEKIGQKVLNYSILGSDSDLELLFKKYKYACITIGQIKSAEPRIKLFKKLKEIGFTLPTIVSPLAYISKHAFIDEGTTVMHHSLINANAKIGKNCIINTKALVEHDAIIENHCHVSTGSILNGAVRVKAGSFIGSNSTSKESITMEGFIKAGEVVK